jgi:hypothetical protein
MPKAGLMKKFQKIIELMSQLTQDEIAEEINEARVQVALLEDAEAMNLAMVVPVLTLIQAQFGKPGSPGTNLAQYSLELHKQANLSLQMRKAAEKRPDLAVQFGMVSDQN